MQATTDRNEMWCDLYRNGESSQQIADKYGVTRERVCQILRRENLIEHRVQRRRLAAEMIEQDRLAVKAAKEALDSRAIDLVKGGMSMGMVAAEVGFTPQQVAYVCKKAGVASLHGRWHDFADRKARLVQLVEEGFSLNEARTVAGKEEGRQIGYDWVWRNLPQLTEKYRRSRTPREVPPAPPKVERPVRVPSERVLHEPLEWDDERKERLVKLWFTGASAQQIADIFGDCSRNAVIGQIHRLRTAGKLQSSSVSGEPRAFMDHQQ